VRFQNGCNKVAIELRVVQFWSKIIIVISNQNMSFFKGVPLMEMIPPNGFLSLSLWLILSHVGEMEALDS